jgi:hypothetical protein
LCGNIHYTIYILFLLQPKAEESIEDNKDDIKEHAMEEEEEKPVPEVVPEVEAAKPLEAAEQRIEMEEEEEEEEEGEPKYIPRLLDGAGKGIPDTIFTGISYRQCCGTVAIFTVLVPTFEKLRFWFRFRLLISYGNLSRNPGFGSMG